ncbi:MAG: hypothetical protein Q8P95_04375 [bacterium]|nr:hypothetical protein [bacterium]
MNIKSPHITREMQRKYSGHTVISLHGKILGMDLDAMKALEKAKKKYPTIDEEDEMLISHIYGEIIAPSIFVR